MGGTAIRIDPDAEELPHSLINRHILFVAIGCAIGSGFFLGSGLAIKSAGSGRGRAGKARLC
jgi:L-asparagine transporter-like permease